MEFSSASFLFIFLPAVFLLYAAIPVKQVRKWLLILSSLLFYAWGGLFNVILLIISSAVNYFLALWMKKRGERNKRPILILAVVFNIGLLAVFKYAGAASGILNSLFGASLPELSFISPVGISFFTFQALSYVIDAYRGNIEPTKDFGKFLLYISFFARLAQGPIVRWSEMEPDLDELKPSAADAAEGMRLFVIGLSMKLVIANTLGRLTAYVFGLEPGGLNALLAWTGALAFLMQLYFDFAGYSQMATGLGRMFGISIPKNFNYPYAACSMTDFWRRWHMTLSGWFRDYVYIPLGGSRRGALRTALNKLTVFLLTGLWHGASLTFLVWGAFNGLLAAGEGLLARTKLRMPKLLGWFLTMLAVTVGFAVFNSKDIAFAWAMVKSMFTGFSVSAGSAAELSSVLRPTAAAAFAVSIPAASPIARVILSKLEKKPVLHGIVKYGSALVLLAVCLLYIASGSYDPSIYARF